MRRIPLLCAVCLAMTAFVAAPPAKADPFHLIRWQDTGYCQIWDEGIPTNPVPGNYDVIFDSEMPSFADALAYKGEMLRDGTCSF